MLVLCSFYLKQTEEEKNKARNATSLLKTRTSMHSLHGLLSDIDPMALSSSAAKAFRTLDISGLNFCSLSLLSLYVTLYLYSWRKNSIVSLLSANGGG